MSDTQQNREEAPKSQTGISGDDNGNAGEDNDFQTLDSGSLRTQSIDSLCMNCGESGTTNLLLVNIPHFREVVISSFSCPHCGYRDSKVDSAAEIQPQGIRYEVEIKTPEDLNRTVVKGSYCSVIIPELGFEDPNNSHTGCVTTVEGVLAAIIENLAPHLSAYKSITNGKEIPPQYQSLMNFVEKVKEMKEKGGFTLIMSDPSGNSFISAGPNDDVICGAAATRFQRTREQCEKIGLNPDQEEELQKKEREGVVSVEGNLSSLKEVETEDNDNIVPLPTECPVCHTNGILKTQVVNVPHFKEIVLLAFTCDKCNFRSVEIKPSGPIEDHGSKITLRVTNDEDLKRDVLKGSFASVELVELGLKAQAGTMGGVFTSLEGLLVKMFDQMKSAAGHLTGDAGDSETKAKVTQMLETMERYTKGFDMPFTIVIDDPTSNSYIQNYYAPDPDPEMKVEQYERTKEQNDELGLTDMCTEGYEKK